MREKKLAITAHSGSMLTESIKILALDLSCFRLQVPLQSLNLISQLEIVHVMYPGRTARRNFQLCLRGKITFCLAADTTLLLSVLSVLSLALPTRRVFSEGWRQYHAMRIAKPARSQLSLIDDK